jgi:hypothetical protein
VTRPRPRFDQTYSTNATSPLHAPRCNRQAPASQHFAWRDAQCDEPAKVIPDLNLPGTERPVGQSVQMLVNGQQHQMPAIKPPPGNGVRSGSDPISPGGGGHALRLVASYLPARRATLVEPVRSRPLRIAVLGVFATLRASSQAGRTLAGLRSSVEIGHWRCRIVEGDETASTVRPDVLDERHVATARAKVQ